MTHYFLTFGTTETLYNVITTMHPVLFLDAWKRRYEVDGAVLLFWSEIPDDVAGKIEVDDEGKWLQF